MRFKGTFIRGGQLKLEKELLPTFEKNGKTIQVLLSDEEVSFVQTPLNTDGPCVAARFNKDALFQAEEFKLHSRHSNMVAFSTDLPLLLRTLRSATSNHAETVEARLVQRTINMLDKGENGNGGVVQISKPFLSFTARSSRVSLVQDLPISKPYNAGEIDQLVEHKEVSALCPYYLDMGPAQAEMQALVDRMKAIADTITLSTSKSGDLYADVSATTVQLGVQVCNLQSYPADIPASAAPDRSAPVSSQLADALAAGDAVSVDLHIKHLARLLHVANLSRPVKILCGIAEDKRHLHVMFVFEDENGEAAYDDSVSLSFVLPAIAP